MVFWIFPCHSDMINCLSKPDVDFTSNVMQLQLRLTFFHYVVDQASIEWKVNTDQKGDISFFSRSLFKQLKKMVEKIKIIFCINMFYWKKKKLFRFFALFPENRLLVLSICERLFETSEIAFRLVGLHWTPEWFRFGMVLIENFIL